MIADGKISFNYLKYLFKVGDKIVGKNQVHRGIDEERREGDERDGVNFGWGEWLLNIYVL